MGRKGGGRKGFLKAANLSKTDDADNEQALAAQEPASPSKEVETDSQIDTLPLNSQFLKDTLAEGYPKEAHSGSSIDCGVKSIPDTPVKNYEVAPESASEETKGQIAQRHKRELKAHKEHIKKLGKKKKDEIEHLDKAIETRHAAEREAGEAVTRSVGNESTTAVAPTAGLYDLKIGSEEKQTKKPTKAQKRREQRAIEEAERDARIAEEKANVAPSEKELEEQGLIEMLRPLGLSIQEIPADGHCMYRAIGDQLKATGSNPAPDVAELREDAASYIRAFPDDFKPFILKDEVGGEDAEEKFEQYCQDVEETAAWGGQLELQALAQALERHISVYSVGMPLVELGTEYKGKEKSLQLCYLRHAFGLGEHYNSIQLLPS